MILDENVGSEYKYFKTFQQLATLVYTNRIVNTNGRLLSESIDEPGRTNK